MNSTAQALFNRLKSREATTAVIGLGYVGLPLLVEFARAGYRAVGFDLNTTKVDRLKRGESYIPDVASSDVAQFLQAGSLRATTDFSDLASADTIDICVPTPLRKTKDPDLSYVVSAAEEIARYLRRGQLVVLESTTYPGTTDEVVQPILERGGLKAGVDFFLAFSPERVDPGNPEWTTANIPKVVGGIDAASTAIAAELYSHITKTVVPVSSMRVAEMVKLLENTFRAVNIGMVNELALMCHNLNVDVWEVIDAAKTKPFGFMPFYPGPGLGGHCIPIDPFYLSWKARMTGFESRFIELAGHINGGMPRFVVERAAEALNGVGKPLKGSRVHLYGMAYKPDVDDVRESPAIDIARLLEQRGAVLSYSDPYVKVVEEGAFRMEAVDEREALRRGFDCAIITTNHKVFDYAALVAQAPLIVDTRNALKGYRGANIVKL
jgi:UDP-N-acetyl-D-glucosamine dehydrogenase